MGKKRVHELAKDYGLENKDVIRILQQAGVEGVKTHSSSVYEEEARAALDRAIGKAAPIVDESALSAAKRPGLRIVRKKDKDEETELAAVAAAAAAAEQAELAAAAAEAEPSDDEVVHEAADGDDETGEVYADEAAGEVGAEAAGEGVGQQAAQEVEGPTAAPQPAVPRVPGQAQVVRMIDREKLLERVPSNRLGGGGPGGERSERGGGRSFGQVTELKVVTDPFGRGREMVTISRDKKGKASAKRPTKAAGPDKRGRQGMRERAMFPSRLRRKKTTKKGAPEATGAPTMKESKRVIKMKETITVGDMAHQLGVKAGEVIRHLMGLGVMATINQNLDYETASLVATEFEYTIASVAFEESSALDAGSLDPTAEGSNLVPRPPVVTIMGHVDHGKTSLLDAIRKSKVAAGEAGGITQHIGAYSVAVKDKGTITFLDTPGHAAFTEMRARGANVTDLVILVVAADDGVMPQTEEAIRHAQAAEVPIIVAINKMDKPEANPDRVTQELTKFNLLPEDWGGETLFVKTSATKGEGLDQLLESILLQAEVLELSANETVNAIGTVVEAQLDKGRGPVATVLLQHGILNTGDNIVVGEFAGRVRAMSDYTGKVVERAKPSDAVEIIGLDGVPNAGDRLDKVDSAEAARELATHRQDSRKVREQSTTKKRSLEDMMREMEGGEARELNLVLKADVQGSLEAIRNALEKLSTDEVKVNVLQEAVGGIKESDIMLANASNGIILGFNVRPDTNARDLAQREGVEIRTYTIIYEMIDDVKKAMEGLLEPESKEKVIGRAEVREVFKISKVGNIAGSRVVDGKAQRSARVRVIRDSIQIFDGRLSSLKRFKDDAREVDQGQECGIGVEGYNDLKAGDVIEFYEIESISRTLESTSGGGGPKRPRGRSVEAHP